MIETLTGGGAIGMGKSFRGLDGVGLAPIDGRHFAIHALETRGYGVSQVFAENEIVAGGRSDRIAREIVLSGAESAGEDHDGNPLYSFSNGGGEQIVIVADDHLTADFDAECVELVSDEEGVGIDALGGERFRTDRDDFGFHLKLSSRTDKTPFSWQRMAPPHN